MKLFVMRVSYAYHLEQFEIWPSIKSWQVGKPKKYLYIKKNGIVILSLSNLRILSWITLV